jgi:purine-binding chemotaxis protein CheW
MEQAIPTKHAVRKESGKPALLDKYLCFLLGEKYYGVNILQVKEIIEFVEVTPIPMMPEFFRGAINLRKRIIPVIDLSFRLGMNKTETVKRTCIVITEIEVKDSRIDVGILVDAVSQVSDIPPSYIEPAPSFSGTINTDFILGISNQDNKFTILLNLDAVFSSDELDALTEFYESKQRRAESQQGEEQ